MKFKMLREKVFDKFMEFQGENLILHDRDIVKFAKAFADELEIENFKVCLTSFLLKGMFF